MPKDHETVPDLNDSSTEMMPLESFAPDEMVRCESCLRANPPTKMSCLYCGKSLPVLSSSRPLQKPTLRPLEKWEHGYNNILMPSAANANISSSDLAEFLRLAPEEVRRIVETGTPLPLARSGSEAEARVIQSRLEALGLESVIVADEALGLDPPVKLRAIDFQDDGLQAYQSRETPPVRIRWNDLFLMIEGRITHRRVEVIEERKRNEKRMLEADQFFDDENVIEFYSKDQPVPWRIMSSSFDFSCLAENKQLVAAENMKVLVEVIRQRMPTIIYDQTYNSTRKTLDPVWKPDQQDNSTGWRRARPGKYSLGSTSETSNESQFSRYSRLRYYLLTHHLIARAND